MMLSNVDILRVLFHEFSPTSDLSYNGAVSGYRHQAGPRVR
ncbi:MAG: hypothetical protein NTU41_03325 [Chloroflexi bacterium]|nr:hypothetical protein [Chloroflexota bacterium]